VECSEGDFEFIRPDLTMEEVEALPRKLLGGNSRLLPIVILRLLEADPSPPRKRRGVSRQFRRASARADSLAMCNWPAPPRSVASSANESDGRHSFDFDQKIWTIET
jgi:hypothetical protein